MTKQPGLTLHDIAGASEDVPVGDSFIRVHGVSAGDGLAIFQRFPSVTAMIGGSFKAAELLKVGPEALGAIIAASVHKLGDEEQELAASQIPLEIQYDILEAVGRLTFKNGFGPFVSRIVALADVANSANFGKALGTKLPPASNPSSQPATPQT